MKNQIKILLGIILVIGLLVGCTTRQMNTNKIEEVGETVGSVLISINPEILVSYNAGGFVSEMATSMI